MSLFAEKAHSFLSDARCGGWSSGQKECIIRDVCKWISGRDHGGTIRGSTWPVVVGRMRAGTADIRVAQILWGNNGFPASNQRRVAMDDLLHACVVMRLAALSRLSHVCPQMTISERLADCPEDSGAANHCPFPRFLCLEVILWRALLYYIKFI